MENFDGQWYVAILSKSVYCLIEYKHLIIIHLYIYEIGGYIGSGKKVRTVKVT